MGDWQTAPAAHLAELDADADKLRLPDQLLFRFTKVQDAMGARLVPAALAALKHAKNGGFVARSGPFHAFCVLRSSFPGGGRARLTQGALVEQDARRSVSPRA